MTYFTNLAVIASQLANTVLLAGNPDQTISARAYVASYRGLTWPMRFIDALFFWQDNHCRISHEQDIKNARDVLATEQMLKLNRK